MIMKSERFFDDREGSGTARTGPEIRWVCGVSRVCNVLSAGVCGWGWPARPAARVPSGGGAGASRTPCRPSRRPAAACRCGRTPRRRPPRKTAPAPGRGGDHRGGQRRLGSEPRPGRDTRPVPPCPAPEPRFRQVEPEVKRRMAAGRHIRGEHHDLAINRVAALSVRESHSLNSGWGTRKYRIIWGWRDQPAGLPQPGERQPGLSA